MRRLFIILCLAGALLAPKVQAHEVRPGYLELRQTATDTYDLLFKIPALDEEFRLGLYVSLPEGTQDVGVPRSLFTGGAYVERRTIRRNGGLTGQTISIEGLSSTFTDVLVRVQDLVGATHSDRLPRPNRRLSSKRAKAQAKSPSFICGLASNTSCLASIICCSYWRWSF